MVVRKRYLLLLTLAALHTAFTGYLLLRWQPTHAWGLLPILLAVVLFVAAAVGWRNNRYYERYQLVTLNAMLYLSLRLHLRRGEAAIVDGKWLYYRSHGKKYQKTPWSRLWRFELPAFLATAVGEAYDLPACVIWAGPFWCGVRHCDTQAYFVYKGKGEFLMDPQPLPRSSWKRLKDMTDTELSVLADEIKQALTHLGQIRNRDRMWRDHLNRLPLQS